MQYLPYLIILFLFILLFAASRGFFKESAVFLLKRFPQLGTYVSAETLQRALMILLAADLLGALMTWQGTRSDTVSKGYIMRNEYGQGDTTAGLEVELEGEGKKDVDLTLSARKLSPEEIREALDEASRGLESAIFGETDQGHISRDLTFPSSVGEPAVSVEYDTSDPRILDWDGYIGNEVNAAGEKVTITARLRLEDEEREITWDLTVFPREMSDTERWDRAVDEAVRSSNDETERKVNLPETLEGKRAVWSKQGSSDGITLLLLGFLMAAFYAYSVIKRKEIDREKREEQMLIDYPNIVSKLVLLLSAGMSLRKAVARIRKDYLEGLNHGGEKRPGYEELSRVTVEMEHGVSELTAYENLGKRCSVPQYRTFSTLLVQNLTKGGSEMALILAREAEEAYEERKKRARILGEQAGTKLLLPMLLMLVIVMVILMVPAFLAFF